MILWDFNMMAMIIWNAFCMRVGQMSNNGKEKDDVFRKNQNIVIFFDISMLPTQYDMHKVLQTFWFMLTWLKDITAADLLPAHSWY